MTGHRGVRLRTRLLVLTIASGCWATLGAQRRPLDGIDAFVEKALVDWQTPGLTLAVVRRDSVLLAKGYGVREYGRPERVDENTLFNIGSCSKAFTSAVIAGLVGDGKVGYEDKAIDHLPWFRLWDPWVTSQVTVRDLMAHRVGADLTIENRLWPFASGMQDLVLRGGRQKPLGGFRERYHYSNNMLVAAGLVAEAVTAKPFARVLHERLLDPLGMTSTRASNQEALATPNRAAPHDFVGGKPVAARWDRWPDSVLLPTGGISSTAKDMSTWLRFQLGRGAFGGRQIVAAEPFDQMHIPHTPVRGGPVEAAYWFAHVDAKDLHTRHWAYGLAWFVTDYRDRPLVWHGGTVNGFRCAMALLPEDGAAMYVGVNRITLLPPAMMLTVLDRLIGGEGEGGGRRDWNAIFLKEAALQTEDARKAGEARRAARVTGTTPSLPLEGYAGRYVDPAIGPLEVTVTNGQLTLRVGGFAGQLTHWHHDTFAANLQGAGGRAAAAPGNTFATFTLDGAGRPTQVVVENLGEFTAQR